MNALTEFLFAAPASRNPGAIIALFGPATELLLEKVWGRGVLPTGPLLYRMGLTFSVGLALFPTLLAGPVIVVRAAMALLGLG